MFFLAIFMFSLAYSGKVNYLLGPNYSFYNTRVYQLFELAFGTIVNQINLISLITRV